MTDTPARHSNRARSLAFRNAVLLYMHDAGLSGADRRPEAKGLNRTERLARDQGDIVGLPWVVGVRCQQSIELSGSLDEAKREAARAGVREYASIQMRKAHSVEESYVTMPLGLFVDVLHRYGA